LNDVRLLQRTALSSSPHIDVSDVDTTSGIFQAIGGSFIRLKTHLVAELRAGFKEFIDYLSSQSSSQKQYDQSVERTKVSTRQFAKRQVQWIKKKLLPAVNAANKSGVKTPVFLLNVTGERNVKRLQHSLSEIHATDLDKWDVEVRDVAARIAHGIYICHPTL
jgi:tRNA dimethylallyltransferase